MTKSRAPTRPRPVPAPPTLEALLESPVGAILDPDKRRYLGWLWRKEGRGWTKPPFHLSLAGSAVFASVDDEKTWMTLGDAWYAWRAGKFDGIGIELLRDHPLRRLDVDGVRDPRTGEICQPALALVRNFPLLVTLSVSGTGLAAWCFAPPLEGEQGKRKLAQPNWPRVGDREPAVELLSHGCYSCLGTVPLDVQ